MKAHNQDQAEQYFFNKKILITGGTGSIGQSLVKKLVHYQPSVIRIYSRDENKQFEMLHEYENLNSEDQKRLRFLLGDVRDLSRLEMAVQEVDIIFHLAALKHVSACEYNPFEAVKTNIIGTQNVIEAAIHHKVEKVIFTSTDKAVNPTNAMGSSKLMAERLMASAHSVRGPSQTTFVSTRFGNVAGTRGSVIPKFIDQIKLAKPITITDPRMTRFLMTMDRALQLIIDAACFGNDGEIYVPNLPVCRIEDIGIAIQEILQSQKKLKTKIIGLYPGEKLHEELVTREESERMRIFEDTFIIPAAIKALPVKKLIGTKPDKLIHYSSDAFPALSIDELKRFLIDSRIISVGD